VEALERRVLFLLIVAALMFARSIGVVPSGNWLIAVYAFGMACLAAAVVLLTVVVAPAEYIGRWDSERAKLSFFAFALLAAQMVVTAFLYAYEVVYASSHF
jgi:hypothetical protein